MITFLRKIRRKLINENRSKYLVYASGEIFLVVVGILIAFSIDNWNDQRKERLKELNYLQDIKTDLLLNLKELEIFRQEKESDILSANVIIKYCENDTITKPEYFNINALNVAISSRFEEINNTFNELENSGQLSLISNKDIKNLLQDMDKVYRNIEFTENHQYTDSRDLIYAVMFHQYDLDASVKEFFYASTNGQQGQTGLISSDEIKVLIKDKGFKNGFVLANYNNSEIIRLLKIIKENSMKVIELIDQELETKNS